MQVRHLLSFPAGNTRGKLGNNDVINCLIHNTLTVAIPPNYTPPCDGTVAVVVIPCRADGSTTAQITIASVEVPVPCNCEVCHGAGSVGPWCAACSAAEVIVSLVALCRMFQQLISLLLKAAQVVY